MFVTRDFLEFNRSIEHAKPKAIRNFFSSLPIDELKWILHQISFPYLVKLNKNRSKFQSKTSIRADERKKFSECLELQKSIPKIE